MVHDLYLVQVKTPEESRRPRATIPPNQAFRPLDRSKCGLVRK